MNAKAVLRVFGVSTGLASLGFMALTFFAEIFCGFGRYRYDGQLTCGITFVEPNPWVKAGELVVVLLAVAVNLGLFLADLRRDKRE